MADAARISNVARRIVETFDSGQQVCAVVSARGDTTDELTRLAREVSPRPPRREMDMLLSAGERISCALVAMAVERLGRPAVSFTGSQAGIVTDTEHGNAEILEVRAHRVQEALERGRIALVAGFQGLSTENQATTLGRGDSDTSAQRRTRARAGRQDLRGCDSTQIHESSLNPGRFNHTQTRVLTVREDRCSLTP